MELVIVDCIGCGERHPDNMSCLEFRDHMEAIDEYEYQCFSDEEEPYRSKLAEIGIDA